MSKRIQNHKKFLKAVRDGTYDQARELIKNSSPNQQKVMGEILHNYLKGNIKTDKETLEKMKHHKKKLYVFVNPSLSPSKRNKLIEYKGGSWMTKAMKRVLKSTTKRASKKSIKKSLKRATKSVMKNKGLQKQISSALGTIPRKQSGRLSEIENEINSTPSSKDYKRRRQNTLNAINERIAKIDELLSKNEG